MITKDNRNNPKESINTAENLTRIDFYKTVKQGFDSGKSGEEFSKLTKHIEEAQKAHQKSVEELNKYLLDSFILFVEENKSQLEDKSLAELKQYIDIIKSTTDNSQQIVQQLDQMCQSIIKLEAQNFQQSLAENKEYTSKDLMEMSSPKKVEVVVEKEVEEKKD